MRPDIDKKLAFDRIMMEYGEDIKRFILTYVKDLSGADDLIQDVFLKVYLNLDTFDEKSSLKTWLYRIAVNQCKDYFRSWHYRRVRLITPRDKFDDITYLTPEAHALKKEEDIKISRAVLSLSRKYREVILLHYYRDFSLEEIASLLVLNASTVRSRIHRARDQLKKKLGGEYLES